MLTITRDKAELGSAPFITFTVYRTHKDTMTVCGYHQFDHQVSEKEVMFRQTPFGIPVAQAFEETRRYAESKGSSTPPPYENSQKAEAITPALERRAVE
jgi:hypothetical protein